MRFIALFSPFDRAQGPVCGEKAGSSRLKCHLDLEPLVLPGEINAMENCAGCNEGLATLPGEVGVRCIARLSPFDPAQGPVYGEKAGSSRLKGRLDSEPWVVIMLLKGYVALRALMHLAGTLNRPQSIKTEL